MAAQQILHSTPSQGGTPIEGFYQDRIAIENVQPEINGGRFPVKRIVGEKMMVTADIFVDGHDALSAAVRYKRMDQSHWQESAMTRETNDSWKGGWALDSLGQYEYTIMAWFTEDIERRRAVTYAHHLYVHVDSSQALFSSWYEMFPRSAGNPPLHGATLREAECRLPGIAEMGFSVVYLPPIHPIGKSFRKGPNNTPQATAQDPGSPWAIGSEAGGHTAVDPSLGTLEDFDHFVQTAKSLGLRVALDLAYQCSPDHPYIRAHPEWFKHRPDGSIQYAENPPKKYEDIVPFDFECADWMALWRELQQVVLFWINHGVHIFRADNPHTKPYRFWEWLIEEVQNNHPEIVFLAEAFTRPKIMQHLAKSGFTQSYTYFTWRNSKQELTDYLTELTKTQESEYLRPNFFANTPDILSAYLQQGGRPAFQIRLILAATLSASYGIYGPPFELCENAAFPQTEDYRDSEKYQYRQWDWNRPGNIKELITHVNRIRKENPALQSNQRLTFYPINHESLLCYAKSTPDLRNVIFVVVNLDPHQAHDGWAHFSASDLGMAPGLGLEMHDLLNDARYNWKTPANYVRLDPALCPAHIFQVRPLRGMESHFDYV